jgi:predicted small metal-binding protein
LRPAPAPCNMIGTAVRRRLSKLRGENNMAKELSCADMGVNCDFKATGETLQEVLQKAGEHAATAHGITNMPPEMLSQVQALVKDV